MDGELNAIVPVTEEESFGFWNVPDNDPEEISCPYEIAFTEVKMVDGVALLTVSVYAVDVFPALFVARVIIVYTPTGTLVLHDKTPLVALIVIPALTDPEIS